MRNLSPGSRLPNPNRYNLKQIGWELERTAVGDGYFGSALYAALSLPMITEEEKAIIQRIATQKDLPEDRQALLQIAMMVYDSNDAVCVQAEVSQSTKQLDSNQSIKPKAVATAWIKDGKMVNAFPRPPASVEQWAMRDRDGYWSQKGYSEAPLYDKAVFQNDPSILVNALLEIKKGLEQHPEGGLLDEENCQRLAQIAQSALDGYESCNNENSAT